MLGINFDLGEDIDMLRDAVWAFARNEILPRAADIDWGKTVHVNLRHYRPELRTVIPERLVGYGR